MWGAYQDFVARLFSKLKIQGIKGKAGVWILGTLIILSGLPFLSEGTPPWPTMFWFLVLIVIAGLTLWWAIERKSSKRNINTIPRYILLVQFLGGIVSSWILLNAFQKGVSFVFDKYGVLDDYRSIVGMLFVIFGFGLTIVGVAVEKRFFCKHVCPYGLLLRFLSALPFSKRRKVRITGEPCIKCAQCNKNCPMGLNPMEEINDHGVVNSPECINCLRCVAKCPKYTLDFVGE
jgi:polyferredoxin